MSTESKRDDRRLNEGPGRQLDDGRAHERSSAGFTLIELLVVVAIIGIVAAIAVPLYMNYIDKARVAAVAGDLRTFETGFVSYAKDNGQFPPDSHLEPPFHLPPGAGMENYLPARRWAQDTPLGGNYNWEGPDNYAYAGISFFSASAPASVFVMLDETIDDGNLGAGKFRVTPNNRYTYIIDE